MVLTPMPLVVVFALVAVALVMPIRPALIFAAHAVLKVFVLNLGHFLIFLRHFMHPHAIETKIDVPVPTTAVSAPSYFDFLEPPLFLPVPPLPPFLAVST
jgi:hypothetical protein